MRICFFIPSFGDGGAQRQCIALLNQLQLDPRVDLHLILLDRGEHEYALNVSRLTVHRISVGNFANPLVLAFVVVTLLRVRPDVLISWLHPADIWSFAATRLVRNVRWMITERGSVYPDSLVFNLRKRFGRRADAVIANSEAGKQLWESLGPRARVRMIPNMVIYPRSHITGSREDECLFVGRLEPEKNIDGVISAFVAFALQNPTARLMVVGRGSQESVLVNAIADAGLDGRVELMGFRRDVNVLMTRARVMISLSYYEGMPNVVMEAIMARIPAVVSDIPEHRALLGDHYPLYVHLDASPFEAASVIAQAWALEPSFIEQAYAFADSVLGGMTPTIVAQAYIDAFAETVSGLCRPAQRQLGGQGD